jgi:peptide/nickel transport system substrate-binding protein
MVMKEPTTRIMALERGDVDLVGFLPYQQIEELKKRKDMTVYSELTADTRWNMFFLGFRNPWLSKKEFRKALALALDRDEITKAAVWGQGMPSFSIILPLHPAYSPELEKMMPYQPELAKKLLKQAGYNGESLTITASKNYPQMYDQAVAAQAMWAALGINTKIEVVDWATVLERWRKGDHDILSFAMIGKTDPWAQTVAMSDKNSYGYKNPKVDELRYLLLKTTDPNEINRIYRQIHAVSIEDVPFLINFYINTNYAVSPRMKNFTTFDLFITRWWNLKIEP